MTRSLGEGLVAVPVKVEAAPPAKKEFWFQFEDSSVGVWCSRKWVATALRAYRSKPIYDLRRHGVHRYSVRVWGGETVARIEGH